jgi:hypothetical protein
VLSANSQEAYGTLFTSYSTVNADFWL